MSLYDITILILAGIVAFFSLAFVFLVGMVIIEEFWSTYKAKRRWEQIRLLERIYAQEEKSPPG